MKLLRWTIRKNDVNGNRRGRKRRRGGGGGEREREKSKWSLAVTGRNRTGSLLNVISEGLQKGKGGGGAAGAGRGELLSAAFFATVPESR